MSGTPIIPKKVERPDWPRMMKRSTAAAYLDVSVTTFDVWVQHGRIPVVYPVLEAMYRRKDLDAFVESLEAAPRSAA